MKVSEYLSLSNEELEKELRYLNEQYREGNPLVSDEIYDYLFDTFKERNPTNKFLTEISAPIIDEKKKAILPYKMFSLDKIKNEEGPLRLWRSKFPGDIVVSDKLDGNSCLLYIKNREIKIFTRGSGYQGQDISYLVPYISIFRNERLKNFVLDNYSEFAIRGELILSKDDWKNIKIKYPELSNDRNTVAGTLNAKSPNYDILKKIRFVAYEWIVGRNNDGEQLGPFKPSEYFEFMYKLGLEVAESRIIKSNDVSLESLSNFLEERRNIGKYVIDGIVVVQDEIHPRDETGNPKYSFAFKSLATQEQSEVTVLDIEWNISKDGLLKPLVLFPPIELDGVIMRKATGKNAKFIEDNIIGVGAKIVITRAGGVIPDILKVTKIADSGKPGFPSDVDYIWNENHVEIIINTAEGVSDDIQDAWDLKRLIYFFVTLETDGVSEGVISRLFEAGYDTVKKIINLKVEDLLEIEGFKQRSSQKVVSAIGEALNKASTLRVMKASNMFEGGIGEKKLKLIADVYPDILDKKKRVVPDIEGLLSIPGIAEITAVNFLECLPNFWTFVEENGLLDYIKDIDKSVKKVSIVSEHKDFLNKTFVFSGFRNKEWEGKVDAAGGTVASGVTKKVHYLIVKDKTESSNKIEKAKELGIPIFNIDEIKDKFII